MDGQDLLAKRKLFCVYKPTEINTLINTPVHQLVKKPTACAERSSFFRPIHSKKTEIIDPSAYPSNIDVGWMVGYWCRST